MSLTPSLRGGRTLLVLALAVLAGLIRVISTSSSARAATSAKPTVVLYLGAWADASSWDGVVTDLQHRGYTVDIPANPLRGLATDAATGNAQVKALVYVDAFIPAQGESLLQILTPPKGFSQPALNPQSLCNFVPFPGAPKGIADLYIKPALFHSTFANDLPAREAAVLAATREPIVSSALTEKSSTPAWKTIPSWDVIGTEDHILPPAVQESMAQRAGSQITKVKASRLTLTSHPDAVANVILAAARQAG